MEPIIEFKDFSFQYRAQQEPTLFNIDLSIYPGEKVLIIGPSGSGKSTLANCINGLAPFSYPGKTTGTLRIKGKDPAKLGLFGISKMVGTVLQDTDGQFIALTVAEDIAFALENDMVPQGEMRERVNEVAELVDVNTLLDSAPGALSGGQKQRVSLGGVIIDDVDILLFDEPLANLDPATGKRAIALIDDLQKKQKKTVIIIEHRLEDALYRDADRVIVVGEGRIVADMKPDELLCTDILARQGIREPLYVTALKHAGCTISPEDRPGRIDTMDFSAYSAKVRDWYEALGREPEYNENGYALQIENLGFSYDGKKDTLKDVSLAVKKGDMVSIVGKNGAGKTTLASLICGFFTPDTGRILVNGEDISPLSIKERGEKIGLVMQNPNQMISKPMIFDEVALGLQVRGVAEEEIKQRVNDTLKICGLYPFRNWPVSALSYGQKKRVTIAAILVLEPEIMILDEPTAGQDYRHYTEIMDFLKMINREKGTTIIMITHDMHLMLEYTSSAFVITDGRLLAAKTPAEVLTDDVLTEKAFLKRTSLYDMALACGIDEPDAFAERFIRFERTVR